MDSAELELIKIGARHNQIVMVERLRDYLNSFSKPLSLNDDIDEIADVIIDLGVGMRSMKVAINAANDIDEHGQLPMFNFDHMLERYRRKKE